jgi:hypothetical protein
MASKIIAKMLLCMTKKASIAPIINKMPNTDVMQDARLFPTSAQKVIAHSSLVSRGCYSTTLGSRIKSWIGTKKQDKLLRHSKNGQQIYLYVYGDGL